MNGNLPTGGQEQERNGDIDSDDEVHENNANLVLRDPKVKKRRRSGKGKGNNVLGSKKQPKKRSSSIRQEEEAGPELSQAQCFCIKEKSSA